MISFTKGNNNPPLVPIIRWVIDHGVGPCPLHQAKNLSETIRIYFAFAGSHMMSHICCVTIGRNTMPE